MNFFNRTKTKELEIRTVTLKIDDDGIPKLSYGTLQRMQEKRQIRNYPIGSKVVTRSNEDEPYKIGVIKAYQPFTRSQSLVPIVEVEDKEYGG